MIKNQSKRWIDSNMRENTVSRVSELPTVIRSGPNRATEQAPRQKNEDDDEFFVVGVTPVGGSEVVG